MWKYLSEADVRRPGGFPGEPDCTSETRQQRVASLFQVRAQRQTSECRIVRALRCLTFSDELSPEPACGVQRVLRPNFRSQTTLKSPETFTQTNASAFPSVSPAPSLSAKMSPIIKVMVRPIVWEHAFGGFGDNGRFNDS